MGADGRLYVGGRGISGPGPVVVSRELKSCLRRVAAAEVFDDESDSSDVSSQCSDDGSILDDSLDEDSDCEPTD